MLGFMDGLVPTLTPAVAAAPERFHAPTSTAEPADALQPGQRTARRRHQGRWRSPDRWAMRHGAAITMATLLTACSSTGGTAASTSSHRQLHHRRLRRPHRPDRHGDRPRASGCVAGQHARRLARSPHPRHASPRRTMRLDRHTRPHARRRVGRRGNTRSRWGPIRRQALPIRRARNRRSRVTTGAPVASAFPLDALANCQPYSDLVLFTPG